MKRDGKKEKMWRAVIAEAGKSGLSVRTFCRQRGVKESLFYFWRRELRLRDADRGKRRGFVELIASVAVAGGSGVCIRIDDRISVAVDRGFDGPTLRAAVDCLCAEAAGR